MRMSQLHQQKRHALLEQSTEVQVPLQLLSKSCWILSTGAWAAVAIRSC